MWSICVRKSGSNESINLTIKMQDFQEKWIIFSSSYHIRKFRGYSTSDSLIIDVNNLVVFLQTILRWSRPLLRQIANVIFESSWSFTEENWCFRNSWMMVGFHIKRMSAISYIVQNYIVQELTVDQSTPKSYGRKSKFVGG